MAKSKREKFLLSHYTDKELSHNDFIVLKEQYESLLNRGNLSIPTTDTLTLMHWAKREEISFGPYIGLSFFEISNRIYSDLVLLEAANILFTKHHIKSIRLNLSNIGGNDMTITDSNGTQVIGEAFNTAPSFFQIKLRSDLRKFDTDKIGYIAFNKSALNQTNEVFLNTKRKQNSNIEFLICNI